MAFNAPYSPLLLKLPVNPCINMILLPDKMIELEEIEQTEKLGIEVVS